MLFLTSSNVDTYDDLAQKSMKIKTDMKEKKPENGLHVSESARKYYLHE